MTTQHDKPKRWRPRVSIRTLVIVVTLVCCYAACWGPTKNPGAFDVYRTAQGTATFRNNSKSHELLGMSNTAALAPLVVRTDRWSGKWHRRYYLWFFGYVAKLPWEREVVGETVDIQVRSGPITYPPPETWEDLSIRFAPPGSSPESQ